MNDGRFIQVAAHISGCVVKFLFLFTLNDGRHVKDGKCGFINMTMKESVIVDDTATMLQTGSLAQCSGSTASMIQDNDVSLMRDV